MSDDDATGGADLPTQELTKDSTNLFPRVFKEYLEIVRGEGVYIYDSAGNEYFDAVAGNQCCNIGHGVDPIADAASDQLRSSEYTSSMLFVNDRSQEFAERMAAVLPPGFEHTWMVSGGSEANESAIKLAREYHLERGNVDKYKVIGRSLSFHGNTVTLGSVSGLRIRKAPFLPMMPEWPKAPAAYPYRCQYCTDEKRCREHGTECAKELETTIREADPATVAAFIAEPIVGAANAAVVPGEEYFPTIRDICDDHDVLLIVDEVMCGMGRTGANFAIDHWDVTPDIITSAKGLSAGYVPLGATFPHEHIVDVFAEKDGGFTHGHTYSFNPGASAIGVAVLEHLDRNDVFENVETVGPYARGRFEEFYDYEFVGDVRGKGLMLGVEFVKDRETKEPLESTGPTFRDHLFVTGLSHGITTYPGGGTVDGERGDHVLITPPLTVSRDEVDTMMDRLHATFQAVGGDLPLA